MRLTWRKQRPSRTRPAGAILNVDGEEAARVLAKLIAPRKYRGWYWLATGAGHHSPTGSHYRIFGTLDGAKDDCEARVRERLGLAPKKKRGGR